MGKGEKRRNGKVASSSRAVELLQASRIGIQFLNLGNDPLSLQFPTGNDEDTTDEFADVNPEFRIAFRKLTKREANTREKGLTNLSELIQQADADSTSAANGIRHFVKFYNFLIFDSVTNIRSAANDTLAIAILKLRKQITEQMLPSTLISKYDPHSMVRRSTSDLLDKCFNEKQRNKIYENAAPRAVKICLQIIQKKHNLVNKQKYDDFEELEQRVKRLIVQSFSALGELSANCPDQIEEIFTTIDGVYDSLAKMGTAVLNAVLLCFLQMIKNDQIVAFTRTNASFKILKLLDSETDVLCKNAFGVYLFMADAKGSGKIETSFSKKEFINDLILRMVQKKGRHFNALQDSLLPLMLVAIKYENKGKSFDWILEVLDAFFDGNISADIYLAWSKAFVEVSDWLYKTFLPENWNEDFAEKLALSTLNFVQTFNERELPSDTRCTFQGLFGDFINRHFNYGWGDRNKLAHRLSALLIGDLPSTASTIDYVFSAAAKESKQQIRKKAFEFLAAKSLVDNRTPDSLFQKLVQLQVYKHNTQLETVLLMEKLAEALKGERSNDDFLECYKYLQGQQTSKKQELSEIVDLNDSANVSRVLRIFGPNAKDFSNDECQLLLKSYISSFVDRNSTVQDPWTDEFMLWANELGTNEMLVLVEEFFEQLNLRLCVKLVLTLTLSALNFNEQQRNQLAISILKRLFAFEQNVDRDDFDNLNKFLEDVGVDLRPFVGAIFGQLESMTECDHSGWFSKGAIIHSLPYISNAMEPSMDSFNNLTQFLDSTFSEQILLNETMLVTAALTKNNYQPFDVDRCSTLIRMLNTATFYMGLKTDNVNIQLYICLCYSIFNLYINGEIMRNELGRQVNQFMQYWNECIKEWNMNNVCERVVYHLVELKSEIPFTVLFTLRQLVSEFRIENLADAFIVSNLDNKQKLRAISSLTFNLPHELLPENEYLHFVNSLEKASQKMKADSENFEIALITLTDLQSKIEADKFDGLFCVFEDDSVKSALSCAVMRICALISRLLPDIDSSIRDFALCGLITAAENFSTNSRSQAPVRLLAILAARFFIYYDINLTKLLNALTDNSSESQVERRSNIEAVQLEWREFFGNSMGNYLMAWFCRSGFTESSEKEAFPEFFRVQISKFIYNADQKLGLFKLVHNPASALFGQIGAGPDVQKSDIFEMLVELLFSDHVELQLTSVQILQRELIAILDVKSEALDQETQMILALRDQENAGESSTEAVEPHTKDIEYKLFEFFNGLMKRLQNIEWSNVNSFDPKLAVADLLIRVVRLLDSKAAATFCARLEGTTIESLLYQICHYINFNESQSTIRKFVQQEPAVFFALWKENVQLDDQDALTGRLLSIENYACWLYRRALETLPAVVREWFEKVKDNRLKNFTQQNISPLLIEKELSLVVVQDATPEFSLRARPNTREIVGSYKVDDVALEFLLTLPEDFPLHSATIQQDKKTILSKSHVNALRKNLFAFLQNANGSLLEGIDQWRRGVEQKVANVEACSICLMIVSSSNYRLPDMKCRTCKNKFHSDCMLKWIRTSQKPSCPLCRADFC